MHIESNLVLVFNFCSNPHWKWKNYMLNCSLILVDRYIHPRELWIASLEIPLSVEHKI